MGTFSLMGYHRLLRWSVNKKIQTVDKSDPAEDADAFAIS